MPTDLTHRIEQLLKERQEHEAAISRIDETLTRVGSALGGEGAPRRRGRPPGSGASASGEAASPALAGAKPASSGQGRRKRRRRGSFATSGEQSVLDFIQSNKNPSTQDVNGHWKGEGRGGTADNTLSKMVREKKLKRTSLEGQRGSTYAVA